ncbi:B3/4 domain-containing protein [Euzebya tangerina]|uniref:B3/B4 domain-containing protein n=1 Tax=Euzebya tangerina TaxID=591198 RepID=UPI000E31BD56|nr:phenylalanine--tRNA ligase beta subunit-related protein [Euzebya tangerina]
MTAPDAIPAVFGHDTTITDTFTDLAWRTLTVRRSDDATDAGWLDATPLPSPGSLEPLTPSLTAWRGVFRRMGLDPTTYRSAAEAVRRRYRSTGSLPSINPLVDVGNVVSLRHALPVAVFDLDRVRTPILVTIARGGEEGRDLAGTSTIAKPGEVIFTDADRRLLARRWCWRQTSEGAVSSDTTSALFVVEAHHDDAVTDLEAAVQELAEGCEATFPGCDIA